jgi:hypothetical protein
MRLATTSFTVIVFSAATASAQTITPSQTRLIGCFGEAFTLVEHVWRIAPAHLTTLAAEAKDARSDARKAFLDGFVSGAVAADQEAAMAVARNLDGCLDAALQNADRDQTTAILAASVRIELDSAIDDVGDYVAAVRRNEAALRTALRTPAADARGSSLDVYLTFGDRMRERLKDLRRKVESVVAAATP